MFKQFEELKQLKTKKFRMSDNSDLVMVEDKYVQADIEDNHEVLLSIKDLLNDIKKTVCDSKRKRDYEDEDNIPNKKIKTDISFKMHEVNEGVSFKTFVKDGNKTKIMYKDAIVKEPLEKYVNDKLNDRKYSFVYGNGYVKLEINLNINQFKILDK